MRVSSPQGRSGDLADLVVDPSPAAPLDRDLVARAGPLHLLVVDLHRLDVLGELGGVPVEPDGVAYRELSGGQTDDGDVGVIEVVGDGSDLLLRHGVLPAESRGGSIAIPLLTGGGAPGALAGRRGARSRLGAPPRARPRTR